MSRAAPQPFAWLARAHLLSAAGDALIAIALAGSLFFSLDPSSARPKVALYLVVTMAPFALVGPFIGPFIDRAKGGRRRMIVVSGAVRAFLAVAMVRHLDSLLLFPEAFGVLVAGKAYHVAKSAVVPRVVRAERDLVEANSKLVLLSGLGGALAAGPGLLAGLLSSRLVLGLAAVCFALMMFPALRLPSRHADSTLSADAEPSRPVPAPLLRTGIGLAASAMGAVRAMTGFTLFFIAFWLREDGAAAWWFGVMLVASSLGSLAGAVTAPLLRRRLREEVLLVGVLVAAALAAGWVLTVADRLSVLLLVIVIGYVAATAKLCFDAIVQRDERPADRGRTFARFETRFQLQWVVGGLVPVITPNGILPLRAGACVLAAAAAAAAFLYAGGLWAVRRGRLTPSRIIQLRLTAAGRSVRARARERRTLGA